MRYRKQRRRCHRMPPAWWRAMAEVAARDLERRIALPERPADPRPGQQWLRITVESAVGISTIVAEIPPGRQRSDRFRVLLDGEQVAELEGRTAILGRIGDLMPRMASRKERHEADRINEQEWSE